MSRLNPKVQLGIILTALAVIPLIYASLLVWSVKDPTGSLDTMSAAIVNEDSPATADNDETLELGNDLTEELLDSDTGFAWDTMDKAAAYDALEAGSTRAILLIPEDFSSAATSLGDEDAMQAATSQLQIITDDASNIIAGNIAATVGEAVRSTISQQVGEEFLAQVTVGFTDIAKSLDEASDGAHQLSDGTASAHSGTGELVVGLDSLTRGANELSEGAAQLSTGLTTASEGAGELADGLQTLDDTTAPLPDRARAIDEDAQELAERAQGAAGNIDAAATNVESVSTGLESALTNAKELDGTTAELLDITTHASDETHGVATDSQALLDQWDTLSEEQRKTAVEQLAEDAASARQSLDSLQTNAESVSQNATGLLEDGSNGSLGLSSLSTDAKGLDDLLSEGATRAQDASQLMNDGAKRLTTATSSFVDGAEELSQAIGAAATASADLSEGLTTLTNGATELDDGTSQLATGADQASAGAGEVYEGLGELDRGAGDLASGLDEGRHEVPRYTAEEGDHLASTASDPVQLEEQRLHEVPGYGWGLAPYFMSLALWVGAMGYFLMRPALNLRLIVRSGSILRAVLGSLTPAFAMAFIQSTLMVTFVRFIVNIDMVHTAGVYALSFFVSLAFFLINQMLIAAFGPPGRFFALVLVVLQLSAAGGTYPIETAPELLQRIHTWLPLTHSVDGLRSLIAGGTFDTAGVLLPIAAWLAAGLLGLIIAVLVTARQTRQPRSDTSPDETTDEGDASQEQPPADTDTSKTLRSWRTG